MGKKLNLPIIEKTIPDRTRTFEESAQIVTRNFYLMTKKERKAIPRHTPASKPFKL